MTMMAASQKLNGVLCPPSAALTHRPLSGRSALLWPILFSNGSSGGCGFLSVFVDRVLGSLRARLAHAVVCSKAGRLG